MESLRQDVRSGGVPKDGIPSIDEPELKSVKETDKWLNDGDIVFGVARGDDVKAYPQRILVWHEIVNDTIDGQKITVSYCPLTGTAMGFERGGTTFGVSGNLLNNNLVMYDRATDSRWPQVLGTAIEGEFKGKSLREFRAIWTTWGQWKQRYPDTVALSKQTGFARDYGRDPYGAYNPQRGYYSDRDTLFPPLNKDDRYHPKKVVMGSRTHDGAIAFVKDALRDKKLLTGDLSGMQYVAVYDSPLDTAYIYRNPEERSFTFTNGRVRADDGEQYAPDELPLERSLTFDAMWFAWSGFYPETQVYE